MDRSNKHENIVDSFHNVSWWAEMLLLDVMPLDNGSDIFVVMKTQNIPVMYC